MDSDSNFFDKLWECFGNSMTMEQIANFALASKVILSYKIDSLKAFHDRLMEGSWKRASNGCIYPLDNHCKRILYVELNEDYEVNLEKSLEKLRKLSAPKVFDKLSEPILSSNIDQAVVIGDDQGVLNDSNDHQPEENGVCESKIGDIASGYVRTTDSLFHKTPVPSFILEMAQTSSFSEGNEEMADAYQVFDEFPEPEFCSNQAQMTMIGEETPPMYKVSVLSSGRLDFELPSLERVLDWPTGSSLSMALGVNVYNPKIFDREHDWRSVSKFEDLYIGDKRSFWSDYGMLEITPGPLYSRAQLVSLLKRWYMLITCSNLVGVSLIHGIRVAICEGGIDPCTTWNSIPYDPGILVIGLPPLVFTYTLEDKGDFRGEEDTSRHYTWVLFNPLTLSSHFSARKINNSHPFLAFVFDPGILFCQSDLWDVHLHNSWFYSEPSLGFCVGQLMVYVLDACFLKLLLPCKAHSIYHVSNFVPALTTILEVTGDFKREGEYAMSTYSSHVIWPKEYIETKNFIWDPGIIAKIAYEQFRTSNVSRVGCRKDIILLILGSMKYGAASSRISDVGTLGFDNLGYLSRSFKISKVLPLGTVEQWSFTMRTMLEKSSARRDVTVNCKFSPIRTISSLVFDPGGWKYSLSIFLQPTEILSFLPCLLAQLNLLEHSQPTVMKFREQVSVFLLCIGPMNTHVRVILIFDPGGYGYWREMMHRQKGYGGNKFNEKTYKDCQFYVFDPGGPFGRLVIDDMEAVLQSGKYVDMPCFNCVTYLTVTYL